MNGHYDSDIGDPGVSSKAGISAFATPDLHWYHKTILKKINNCPTQSAEEAK